MLPLASQTLPREPEDEPAFLIHSNGDDDAGNYDVDENDDGEELESASDLLGLDLGLQVGSAPLPQATLPNLLLTQQLIEAIKTGELHDDIQDPEIIDSLKNPPKISQPLDPITTLSIKIFKALILGSQQMYDGIRDALCQHTPAIEIHSYYITRRKLEEHTGITEIRTDMCPKGCIAYTGPFASLENCPECTTSRYKTDDELSDFARKKKARNEKIPRQQFYTIPLGPQIQALWRTPQSAFCMRYHNQRTAEILALAKKNHGIVPVYEDVFDGKEYLDAYLAGQVRDDDTLLMFSWDGAQLYRDKESDCFFGIWIVLNLSPELRYKMKHILPALIIPGPNSP